MARTASIPEVGSIFGKWEVLGRAPNRGAAVYIKVRCTCGSGIVKEVQKGAVVNGYSTSCGCFHIQRTKESNSRHGLKNTPIYQVWRGMKRRCNEENNKDYENYGGRGIKVCGRWMDVNNFYQDMGQPPEGHSIERVDNSKGYQPGNCVWATSYTQSRNKRNNVYATFFGVTKVLRDWVNILGHSEKAVVGRIKAGMTPEQALLTPGIICSDPERVIKEFLGENVQ